MAGFPPSLSRGGPGWSPMSTVAVDHNRRRLFPLIQSSLAPTIWAGHGKAWNEWCALVADRNVSSSSEDRLAVTLEYLFQLRDAGSSAAVAKKRLSGVAFFFRLNNWPDSTKEFFISQVIRGWKKEITRRESRRPVSFQLLIRLLDVLPSMCNSDYEAVLFRTSFCLAFFGALRISELVPPSASKPGGLRMEDIIITDGGVRLRIRKSKTDVFGRGCWIHILPIAGPACPVSASRLLGSLRPPSPSFLAHKNGLPLTRFQFFSIFRKALKALNLPPEQFGTHSFRIGAATTASELGLSDEAVMRLGRWKSSCFAGYVRPDLLV